jgi:hypothetical protein
VRPKAAVFLRSEAAVVRPDAVHSFCLRAPEDFLSHITEGSILLGSNLITAEIDQLISAGE